MKFGKKWNADNMRCIFFTLCNCFTGSCPHGEQAHRCLEQTPQEPDCPIRSPALDSRLCGSGASSWSSSSSLCAQAMIASMSVSHP